MVTRTLEMSRIQGLLMHIEQTYGQYQDRQSSPHHNAHNGSRRQFGFGSSIVRCRFQSRRGRQSGGRCHRRGHSDGRRRGRFHHLNRLHVLKIKLHHRGCRIVQIVIDKGLFIAHERILQQLIPIGHIGTRRGRRRSL